MRWLRPEFQAPNALPTQAALGGLVPANAVTTKARKQPWPAALTDQVRAIKDSLRAQPLQTPQQIASGFKPASRTRVAEILDTLTALGQTRAASDDRYSLSLSLRHDVMTSSRLLRLLLCVEEGRINLLNQVRALDNYPDPELDTELRQSLTIDQYDPVLHTPQVVHDAWLESRRCDEDSFMCPTPGEATDEVTDLRCPHLVFPALRLDVDPIQAQTIFVDKAIDTTITGTPRDACVLLGPAVSHLNQQPNHQLLKEGGRFRCNLFQQLGGELLLQHFVRFLDHPLWGLCCAIARRKTDGRLYSFFRLWRKILQILGKALQELLVDSGRVLFKTLMPYSGEDVTSPTRPV